EAFHGRKDPRAIAAAWPHLAHADRFVRWAARTAVEHQPVGTWSERALKEPHPGVRAEALLALARAAGVCPSHQVEGSQPADRELGGRILRALAAVDWQQLNHEQRLAWMRGLQIALHRFAPAEESLHSKLRAKLDPLFPAASRELNALLCETLVYLQSPHVAAK